MSNNVEWARLTDPWGEINVQFEMPGEVSDPFGNENELPALFFGDGICIEDTKEHWLEFAEKLLSAIQSIPDGIVEADLEVDPEDEA